MYRSFSIIIALLATVGLLASCGAPNAGCQTDGDCPEAQMCLSGGGVFFGGGRCVSRSRDTDPTPDTDRIENRDTSRDTPRDSFSPPEEDTGSAMPRDTGTSDDTGPIPDTRDPVDTGSQDTTDTKPVDRTCDYMGLANGICRGLMSDDNGTCPKPPTFESMTDRESTCDGKDNDCDGTIDEGCPCESGDKGSCYGGPPQTQGVGRCTSGTRTCNSNGTWGACTGDVVPAKEQCGDGLDSDCDGAKSEGCACDYRGKRQGVCQNQTVNAQDVCPRPVDYEGATNEEAHCDGKDNDCDGAVDEGCPCNYQSKSSGVCKSLKRDASGNCPQPSDYMSPTNSEKPNCDGKDNDCDGNADEGCDCTNQSTKPCYTGPAGTAGVGACSQGVQTCSGGSWGSCQGETTPTPESCSNSTDDDCDGVTNESCPCNYKGLSNGVCANATSDNSGICQRPATYETSEASCGDGLDNDCDAAPDCIDSSCPNPCQ